MKLAIHNGFPFHYEMFGYIIEYCITKGIKLDIYTLTMQENGWINFYMLVFPDIRFFDIQAYNPDNDYSKVILTTDYDATFQDRYFSQDWASEKYICINHSSKNNQPKIVNQIGTRFFPARPSLNFIIPVYPLIDIESKKQISKPRMICLGANCPKNMQIFEAIFPKFREMDIYCIDFFSRITASSFYSPYPNIKSIYALDTLELIKIMRESDYMYISEDPYKCKITESMSGAIPLAFNCLCQLIMPERMNEYFKLKSVITYDYKNPVVLSAPSVKGVDDEMKELMAHKYKVFDSYIFSNK